ncbi:MAG TPA: hypothetical protein VII47_02770, partial [Actinomycetota bacterium]
MRAEDRFPRAGQPDQPDQAGHTDQADQPDQVVRLEAPPAGNGEVAPGSPRQVAADVPGGPPPPYRQAGALDGRRIAKNLLLGRPLATSQLRHERLGKPTALA